MSGMHDERNESILMQLKPIQEYLDDKGLSEICINRPGELMTEGRDGWKTYERPDLTYQWCYNLAKLLGSLNAEKPSLPAELPGGQRIHIVGEPRVEKGTISITIRRPAAIIMSIEEYEAQGVFRTTRHEQSVNLEGEERNGIESQLDDDEKDLLSYLRGKDYKSFFKNAVEQRRNILISGSTGSGKTTFANAIVRFIPEDERIIPVEEVSEIRIPHIANRVNTYFKKAAGGPKPVFEDTLRMRPDRVLPAELRGDESYYFLQNVLNSGHPGAITTIHSNRTKLAFMRLALMIQSSPEGKALSYENIMSMLFSLIDVVVQIVRMPDRSRAITEIYYDPAYARKQMG
ncbi:MAG: P-type DNA transfer ATPase VirB11 [Burkholderiales bacterium]